MLYWTGTAQDALGNSAEARKIWTAAAAGARGSQAGAQRYYQALALEKLGGRDKAATMFRGLIDTGTRAIEQRAAVDYFAKFGERQSRRASVADGHYLAGLGCLGLRDAAKAGEHFRQAIAQSPDHLGARTALEALK